MTPILLKGKVALCWLIPIKIIAFFSVFDFTQKKGGEQFTLMNLGNYTSLASGR